MAFETEKSLFGIHESFAETELGMALAANVRYEKYKPEGVANERWEELLGADVNNLDHLALTYGLTKSMIRHLRVDQPDFLNEHEEQVLLATALIHDWAEAIIGDIDFNDKTEEDEAAENLELSTILGSHFDGDSSGIKELVLESAQYVHDNDSKLGKLFNTIERVGYVRTALRAAERSASGNAADCENGLDWLTSDVFGNQLEVLMERSATYSPVKTYLNNQRPLITEAFCRITQDVFLNYDTPEKRLSKEKAFLSAWRQWVSWVEVNVA